MMASLFWQLLVQMDILSPLGLTLTTAPQTSSLASSNDSPTKHKSYKPNKILHTMNYICFFHLEFQTGTRTSIIFLFRWLPFPSNSDQGHCVSVVYWELSAIDPPACSCHPPTSVWYHPVTQSDKAIKYFNNKWVKWHSLILSWTCNSATQIFLHAANIPVFDMETTLFSSWNRFYF